MTPTLTKSFNQIVAKQKELNYNFPLRSAASVNLIKQTENELSLKFNDELVELYSIANGVEDSDSSIEVPSFIPTYTFLSLEDASDHYKIRIPYQDSFLNQNNHFKPENKLFPFLEDGAGNYYWVDLNENTENYGKILWTNTFGENPDYHYSSLTIFLLVVSECYEKSIISVDSDGYLDCNQSEFSKISKHFSPELKYWDTL